MGPKRTGLKEVKASRDARRPLPQQTSLTPPPSTSDTKAADPEQTAAPPTPDGMVPAQAPAAVAPITTARPLQERMINLTDRTATTEMPIPSNKAAPGQTTSGPLTRKVRHRRLVSQ